LVFFGIIKRRKGKVKRTSHNSAETSQFSPLYSIFLYCFSSIQIVEKSKQKEENEKAGKERENKVAAAVKVFSFN